MGAVTSFLVRNSPKILTGLAAGGTVLTAVLASKETMIAQSVLEEYKLVNPNATKKDVVKKALPIYIPAIISGVATIGCIIGAAAISSNRIALLESACSMGSIAATKYHEAMVESLGKEKEQEIRDLMLTKKSKEHPPEEGKILYTGKGEHVFLEPWTMTYFRSSYASIMKAYREMEEAIDSNCEETLTEWFYKLGLPKTYNSDKFGWNDEHKIKIHIHYTDDDDGDPCGIIVYDEEPGFYVYNGGWRS